MCWPLEGPRLEVQGKRGTWWLCGMCPHDSASLLMWRDNHGCQGECRIGIVSMFVLPRCKAASSERAWHLEPHDSRMLEIRRLGQVLKATGRLGEAAALFCCVHSLEDLARQVVGLTVTGSGALPMQLQGFSTNSQRPLIPSSQTKTLS